ncbi:MAG: ABC transporter ATP-binding protein [Rhodothalassiaceae bacterium]|nr:MAG: ABC transporter ATP-binding protein [Rhodothalassiaceae bacterium]
MTTTQAPERGIVARLEGVSRSFGPLKALDRVDLEIRAGERLALVGHNGSGKSTLIKLLLGFLRADAGAVTVLGRPPDARDGARMRGRIAYLPERVAFDPQMTGREVLRFYARLKRADARDPAIEALLEEVGLAAAADRRIAGWSKGMQQRLGLAVALLGEADLYLFDEPTTGLDPLARRWFFDLALRLAARGRAVVIASHVLAELERIADRAAMISSGRLFAVGTLEELRARAGLPQELHLRLPPERLLHAERAFAGTGASLSAPGPGRLVVSFADAARARVLARLAELAAREELDFSFSAPGLDALYAALLERAGPARDGDGGGGFAARPRAAHTGGEQSA